MNTALKCLNKQYIKEIRGCATSRRPKIKGEYSMKKTVICNIPMREKVTKTIYRSDDLSVPVSSREVMYPINAFFEKTLSKGDEIDFVLLAKTDEYSSSEENIAHFKAEFSEISKGLEIKANFRVINTAFSQKPSVHEELMEKLVDNITTNSQIYSDMTYGPKDMSIILFTALRFADKFLNCQIENIIYGQANFKDGEAFNTKIYDMMPLFYLNSLTETVNCSDPENARKMLKTLLDM